MARNNIVIHNLDKSTLNVQEYLPIVKSNSNSRNVKFEKKRMFIQVSSSEIRYYFNADYNSWTCFFKSPALKSLILQLDPEYFNSNYPDSIKGRITDRTEISDGCGNIQSTKDLPHRTNNARFLLEITPYTKTRYNSVSLQIIKLETSLEDTGERITLDFI
jgi:hypothetical protein